MSHPKYVKWPGVFGLSRRTRQDDGSWCTITLHHDGTWSSGFIPGAVIGPLHTGEGPLEPVATYDKQPDGRWKLREETTRG